jgi:arylformamidase
MKPRLDPAWLDAQYNNRALVPDFAPIVDGWAKASALARDISQAKTHGHAHLDLAYGDGPSETLDIFPTPANGAGSVPVLVFIHGGYWRALDKSDCSFLAPSFNADGAMLVVPNYALCPAVSIEHIALQLARAVVWLWHNVARFGGDPSRIALAGHSAGGHLVTLLLSCRWRDLDIHLPLQPLAGALSISGLYDLEPIRHTPFLQPDLKLTPASVARLSPAFFPRPKGTRLYATVGLDESSEFQRQNALIRDVWGPTAVPVCETVPHTNHFTILNTLADPKSRLHDLALRLLGLR